jgi:hypothetical protein
VKKRGNKIKNKTMAAIKSILKQFNLTTKEDFIEAISTSGKEKEIVQLLHEPSIEQAAGKLFWEISFIVSNEAELKERKSMSINWDRMQKNTYNIELGDLNERKQKLERLLSRLQEILVSK